MITIVVKKINVNYIDPPNWLFNQLVDLIKLI